jgi:hypothetical protein
VDQSRTARVVQVGWDIIVKSMKALSDEDRDVPLAQDLFHIMGVVKLATLLANKRGLNPEIATITMILHDHGRILTGVWDGHDEISPPLVRRLLERLGDFTSEEIDQIVKLTRTHRHKDETGDPYEECIRDADVLDIYLGGTAGWTRAVEPLKEYIPKNRRRLEKLAKELGFKIIEA